MDNTNESTVTAQDTAPALDAGETREANEAKEAKEKSASPKPGEPGEKGPGTTGAAIKKYLPYALPTAAVMVTMLVSFFVNKLYPFGVGTVAWCDMTQQVVPLLCDLKDILTGKSGLFLNFNNAGGMDMWGVLLFFVTSPLSLLVVFVDKADMIFFANILVMLKLMLCALTAVIFFKKRVPQLGDVWSGIFAVTYAFSGYAMLYYQNVIWLDMMYLFPLLLWAFGEMVERRRVAPYVAVLTAMMVVNYYLSYMVVMFILLFMGLFCLRYRKDKHFTHAGQDLITGSLLSALLTGIVWLPSLFQYLSSGRRESIIERLEATGFYTRYQTTLPTIMHSVLVIVILLACLMDGHKRDKRTNTYLIMAFLLAMPLYVEPINIMWHTGSYQAFPSRYGFITQFLMTAAAAMMMSDKENRPEKENARDRLPIILLCAGVIYGVSRFSSNYIGENRGDIGAYATSLWGNDKSFHLIIKLMMFMGAAYLLFYLLYRKGKLSREIFALICAVLVVVEGYNNMEIYMTMPNQSNPDRAVDQRLVMDMSDQIKDDSGFYRVATASKLFDVNLVGAMGYNSLSHYTSLTDEDYMFMMKRLGYSSYWMEVGSYGGTEMTDALMSVKYRIEKGEKSLASAYSNEKFTINYNDSYLPLGQVISADKSEEPLDGLERSEIQQFIYENSIGTPGDQLVTKYELDEGTAEKKDGVYKIPNTYILVWNIDVKGRQSVYFDCFDKLSNALKEDINDSFSVAVDGSVKDGSYPNKSSNGLMYLGTYENEHIQVTATVMKECTCTSFGVFSIDLNKLDKARVNAKTVGFTEKRGKLTGEVAASAGEKCLVSVPYTDQLRVRVNGHEVEYRKMFDDMIVFDLEEGVNEIKITGSAKGFLPGLIITLIGIAACVFYKKFGKKIILPDGALTVTRVLIIAAGAAVLLLLYVMPLIVNMRVVKGIS